MKRMNKGRKRWTVRIGYALGLALLLVAMGFIGERLWRDREALSFLLHPPHPQLLWGHLGLLALTFFWLAAGWMAICRAGGVTAGRRPLLSSWLIPNAGKYAPGKVLMVGGRIEMLNRQGVRRSLGAGLVVYEQVGQVLAAGPFFVWALAGGLQLPTVWTLGGTLAVLMAVLGLFLFPSLLTRGINAMLKRLKRPMLEVAFNRRGLLTAWAQYLLGWLAYGGSGILLIRVFGFADQVPVVDVIPYFVAAWLVGFCAVVTPGGAGVREAVLIGFLSQYMSPVQAAAIAVAARVSWTLVEAGGVVIGFILQAAGRNRATAN